MFENNTDDRTEKLSFDEEPMDGKTPMPKNECSLESELVIKKDFSKLTGSPKLRKGELTGNFGANQTVPIKMEFKV